MEINEPLHEQVHLWMIASIIIFGYLAVVGNMYWVKKHVRNRRGARIIFTIILLSYVAGYVYLTYFYRTPMEEGHARLEPFWSYREAFDGWKIKRLGVARSILLNLAITIPLGYLLPSVYKSATHRYFNTFLTVFFLSLITETIQLISKTGLCETDDVINNSLGACIGIVMFITAEKGIERIMRKD